MPQQPTPSAINNLSKGYVTEYTGLNFPEDAVTDTQNCIFERVGNAHRRLGINYETNFTQDTVDRTSKAISTYKWNNVGGDGLTQIEVRQIGATLYFFRSSDATIASPLSTTLLGSTVDVSSFIASGGSYDATVECQYADGNGYLFVFHPSCDPFYISYSAGTLTGITITVKIRDFQGIVETVDDTFRPTTLTSNHNYNLLNQGWTSAPAWATVSTTSNNTNTGSHTWTVDTGLTISNGQVVSVGASLHGGAPSIFETGTVTSYNSGTGALTLSISSTSFPGATVSFWSFAVINAGLLTTWNTAEGNYPANADVWWRFKNTSGVFAPATTAANITLNSGPANKGFYILEAFNQKRATVSGVSGPSDVITIVRPKTGCWFQGRVWYTGIDSTVWTENIYFSQIIERVDQFGKCYQVNDPTSEDLFDELPTDGGVLQIQGAGNIYKLFSIQNGLLVFAANGVWFITGSQGIGFAATDFTVVKISAIQSISSTSFVDVRGAPMWWNEEGIYTISPGQGTEGIQYGGSRGSAINSGLTVEPLTFTTIQTFYQSIPLQSKKYVRGAYDSLNWDVRWAYRSTNESSTTNRYQFDSLLVLNTVTKAFYPWNISTTSGVPYIHGLTYVQGPGGSTSPDPIIKYLCSVANAGSYKFTFAEENDYDYVDWSSSGIDYDYTSDFTTGFSLKGQAQHRFQTNYVYIYSNNEDGSAYRIQSIWDFASHGDSGKMSTLQLINNIAFFGVVFRRYRLRGRGLVAQMKISSVSGAPFDIIGWSIDNRINTGQ